MSTTAVIHGLSATTVLTAVPKLDQANLIAIDGSVSSDGNTREALYQLASGNEDYPMTFRVAIYRKPNAGDGAGETVCTVKIQTTAVETDDSTGETVLEGKVTASLTVTMPGSNVVFNTTEFHQLIGNLYTAFFTGVDGSNVPNNVVLDKLKFAIPSIF